MKTLVVLAMVLSLVSCGMRDADKVSPNSNRIKEVEERVTAGVRISIINVDGKEFLINSQGGITPLK